MTTGSAMKYPSCSSLDWRAGSGKEEGTSLVLITLCPAGGMGWVLEALKMILSPLTPSWDSWAWRDDCRGLWSGVSAEVARVERPHCLLA